jgi:DUF2892 family protein
MIYRKNMGRGQSFLRVLAGGLIVACCLTRLGFTPLGIGLAASGVLTMLTGMFGFCPACAMAGRKRVKDPQ